MNRSHQDATSPTELFDLLWESLADVLGTAATATLLRRAIKRAASHTPWSESVLVAKNGLDYEYRLPETGKQPGDEEALAQVLGRAPGRGSRAARAPRRADRTGCDQVARASGSLSRAGDRLQRRGAEIRVALGIRVFLVALTAHGLEEDRRRSSEAGFDGHLVKPVSYEDLTRLLGRVGPSDA